VLFEEQTVESLAQAILAAGAARDFESQPRCRRNAERFGSNTFRSRLTEALERQLSTGRMEAPLRPARLVP
jgi:hypothetical protein